MLIKQLSIFLENKSGRFKDVTNILGREGINMVAFSIAETAEFGILRLIVSDPEKAYKVLKEEKFAASLNDVICLQCPNVAGSLGKILTVMADAGISTEYMYAFANGDVANVVIRPDNLEKCVKVLQDNKQKLVEANDFYQF